MGLQFEIFNSLIAIAISPSCVNKSLIYKIKNYLYCIAGNTIKNYYKKRKDVLMDELPEIEDYCIENVDIRMDIEQAVDCLPNEIKEVAILFFFQDLKQREIAELLNIKLSLVKYRIGRAKQILSENLEVKK
mgnify:CR=1 FL=1